VLHVLQFLTEVLHTLGGGCGKLEGLEHVLSSPLGTRFLSPLIISFGRKRQHNAKPASKLSPTELPGAW